MRSLSLWKREELQSSFYKYPPKSDFSLYEIISVGNHYECFRKGDRGVSNLRSGDDKHYDVGVENEIRIFRISPEPHSELRRLRPRNRVWFERDPDVLVPFFKPVNNILRYFVRHAPQRDFLVISVVLFEKEFGAFFCKLVHVFERLLYEFLTSQRICHFVDPEIDSLRLKIFAFVPFLGTSREKLGAPKKGSQAGGVSSGDFSQKGACQYPDRDKRSENLKIIVRFLFGTRAIWRKFWKGHLQLPRRDFLAFFHPFHLEHFRLMKAHPRWLMF